MGAGGFFRVVGAAFVVVGCDAARTFPLG